MDEILIVTFTAILASIIGCLAAAVRDLKTSLIPNKIPFTLIVLSVPLALTRAYFVGIDFLVLWIVNFALAFILAYVLWHMRAWSGGDGKMFWAVVALIPTYPDMISQMGVNFSSYLSSLLSYTPAENITVVPQLLPPYLNTTFIVTFFLNLGVLLLAKLWLSALLKSIHEGAVSRFTKTAVTPFLFVFSSVSFAAGLSTVSRIGFAVYAAIPLIFLLSYLLKRYGYPYTFALSIVLLFAGLLMSDVTGMESFILFLKSKAAILFFVFLLTAYVVGSESERVLSVEVGRLKRGMPIAEKIYLKNKKIVRKGVDKGLVETINSLVNELKKGKEDVEVVAAPAPSGLTDKDIVRLEKHKKELGGVVRIYIGVRLMPFMLLALLVSLFVGDLMWMFLYLGGV